MVDLHALASDPNTPAATLAQLAAERPELQPLIAQNPAAYAGLLDWIMQYGTPEGRAAATQRLQYQAVVDAAAQYSAPAAGVRSHGQPPGVPDGAPAPGKSKKALWIILAALSVVVVAVGAVALFIGRTPAEPPVDERAEAVAELLDSIHSAESSLAEAQAALDDLRGFAEDDPEVAGTVETTEEALDEFAGLLEDARTAATLTPEGGADESAEVTLLVVTARELDEATADFDGLTEDIRRMTAELADRPSSEGKENEQDGGGGCVPVAEGAYPCAGGPIPEEARPITSLDDEWATLQLSLGAPGAYPHGCSVYTLEGERRATCSSEIPVEFFFPAACEGDGDGCRSRATLILGYSGPVEGGAPYSQAPPYTGEFGTPQGEMLYPGDVVYHGDYVFAVTDSGVTFWNASTGYGTYTDHSGGFYPIEP